MDKESGEEKKMVQSNAKEKRAFLFPGSWIRSRLTEKSPKYPFVKIEGRRL